MQEIVDALPRHRNMPTTRSSKIIDRPRPARRQGNADRPLLSRAARVPRRDQPLQDGGHRLPGHPPRRGGARAPDRGQPRDGPRPTRRRPRPRCSGTISPTAPGTRTPTSSCRRRASRRARTRRSLDQQAVRARRPAEVAPAAPCSSPSRSATSSSSTGSTIDFARGPDRADRRDRRRQVDPARCAVAGARRARRQPRWSAHGAAQGDVTAVFDVARRPSRPRAPRRQRHRRRGRPDPPPRPGRRRPQPRLRQRPAGVGDAAPPGRRGAGRDPRPARRPRAGRRRRHRALLDAFGGLDAEAAAVAAAHRAPGARRSGASAELQRAIAAAARRGATISAPRSTS